MECLLEAAQHSVIKILVDAKYTFDRCDRVSMVLKYVKELRKQRASFEIISRSILMMVLRCTPLLSLLLLSTSSNAFTIDATRNLPMALHAATQTTTYSFIDEELRGAAMKLHTREQAPKEGQVVQAPASSKPYTPGIEDYLAFLVDSQHVYAAFERIVHDTPELADFCDTGLERTIPLEKDIEYVTTEYNVPRPEVGTPGREYAELLPTLKLPAFVCHYYNHYFAHTAGGRMIGKKMSSLLLNDTTLEFYKVRSFRH